jgi:hypothetical protein
MPLTFVSGDPLLTRAQVLAIGGNAQGQVETGALETLLYSRYPTAFAAYRKSCRAGKITTGTLWLWRETQPSLGIMVVRESAGGTTRLRYLENIVLTLARDYRRDGLTSLALVAPGAPADWPTLKPVIQHWLAKSLLPVTVYERYLPGIAAETHPP